MGRTDRIDTVTAASDFALLREQRPDGEVVLTLAGELDLYRAPEIEAALADAIGRADNDGPPTYDGGETLVAGRVTVDLRAVTFIDSTTLALLLTATRRQRARGGMLLVLVGAQTPMTAFEVTTIDRLLTIRRDQAPSEQADLPSPGSNGVRTHASKGASDGKRSWQPR